MRTGGVHWILTLLFRSGSANNVKVFILAITTRISRGLFGGKNNLHRRCFNNANYGTQTVQTFSLRVNTRTRIVSTQSNVCHFNEPQD